ncbi:MULTISPECIES: universal stress protein [Brachybacterium]|uniref:Universal stress protein UspA n=1 Tax=Brachybacterium alimentarium TaxID=47845 RepID=A0A2A3YKL8_9MICO|nr:MULTISPECIES: universal stress protein [Brachybacterium]PCC34247.1 universal stress protein UspA [Brachybacterium alimentarium]PCC39850.1 universal stress protein UspA [Brachybacterium alimentarium]RCS67126.1 universal stress protein [Brachybacterium sp. JB7]RCS68256.1 universal stress protein [Brachybacterium alimentarium]RCS69844.1 universal stress protein [Brachybacterium alimentarium]
MTIVVAYTPSEQGRAALQAAVRSARRSREGLAVAYYEFGEADDGLAAPSEEDVRSALAEADVEGLDVTLHRRSMTDIGEFLLAVIDEVSASLLVIGLRRKSPIGKLNLGNAARRVVLGAPCPVLAVKDGLRAAA